MTVVTIHTSDPFATPDEAKAPVRRLRGRLPSAVTLWTAYDRDGRPAGLTVSSTVLVDGDPGRVLGLLDEESAVWEAITRTGRFALMALRVGDAQLADMFAGLMPAPGGPFAAADWTATPFGPVVVGTAAWAGCQLDGSRQLGWSLLVEGTISQIELAPAADVVPLVHYRGRYHGAYPRHDTVG